MTESLSKLPPDLVSQMTEVMGDAFLSIRQAMAKPVIRHESVPLDQMKAIGILANAIHEWPALIDLHHVGIFSFGDVSEARILKNLILARDVIVFLNGYDLSTHIEKSLPPYRE